LVVYLRIRVQLKLCFQEVVTRHSKTWGFIAGKVTRTTHFSGYISIQSKFHFLHVDHEIAFSALKFICPNVIYATILILFLRVAS